MFLFSWRSGPAPSSQSDRVDASLVAASYRLGNDSDPLVISQVHREEDNADDWGKMPGFEMKRNKVM